QFPDQQYFQFTFALSTVVEELQKLRPVCELSRFTALDEYSLDFNTLASRKFTAGELLRFEARAFDLLFGRNSAVYDAVFHPSDCSFFDLSDLIVPRRQSMSTPPRCFSPPRYTSSNRSAIPYICLRSSSSCAGVYFSADDPSICLKFSRSRIAECNVAGQSD